MAETWAQAGEIDKAKGLAVQVPDRMLARVSLLREIASAQARASHREEAEAAFGRALALALRWNDPFERVEALEAIAQAQEAAGLKADAGTTVDQVLQTRAQTLLAIVDLQMRAGAAAEATLDEARAAEHDARFGRAQWPSYRDPGIRITTETSSGNVRLLCDIAKAQARAGLNAKAIATFDEAMRAAQAISFVGSNAVKPDAAIAGALVNVADAQREAGLITAARETLDRAALSAEASFGRKRAVALLWLAEARTKAGDADAAQNLFARALTIGRTLRDDPQRARALQQVAVAQIGAGLHNEGLRTFVEAVAFARLQRGMLLSEIANAQHRAGLTEEAAATFGEALSATISDDEKAKEFRLTSLIGTIAQNDPLRALVAARPSLRLRLLEAVQAIPDRLDRAAALSVIARALPN
jgi:tetratricopeptide (TPR) repeat protein